MSCMEGVAEPNNPQAANQPASQANNLHATHHALFLFLAPKHQEGRHGALTFSTSGYAFSLNSAIALLTYSIQ